MSPAPTPANTLLIALFLLLPGIVCAAQGDTRLVSVREGSDLVSRAPNNSFASASITPDGRYVVFASPADNLLPDPSGIFTNQIYRFDSAENKIELVSATPAGQVGNGISSDPTISDDGRYVAYVTRAPNLLGVEFLPSRQQLVLTDMETRNSSPISLNALGDLSPAMTFRPVISGNGERVFFGSDSFDLQTPENTGKAFLLYYDRLSRTTELASKTPDGTPISSTWITHSVNHTGNIVVFDSDADELTPDFEFNNRQALAIFVDTGSVSLLSNFDGLPGARASSDVMISSLGNTVVFTNRQVYLADVESGDLRVVSNDPATGPADRGADARSINADGTIVTFRTSASGLPTPAGEADSAFYRVDTQNNEFFAISEFGLELFNARISGFGTYFLLSYFESVPSTKERLRLLAVKDLSGGASQFISAEAHLSRSSNDESSLEGSRPISSDAEFVAFSSLASNLLQSSPGLIVEPKNYLYQQSEDTVRAAPIGLENSGTRLISLSGDGSVRLFTSLQSDLVEGDNNNNSDIFHEDSRTGLIQRVNRPVSPSENSTFSSTGDMSENGRFVAFSSATDYLGVGGQLGLFKSVYVRDMQSDEIWLVCPSISGTLSARGCGQESVSADGRFVAFTSRSGDLIVGQDAAATTQAYVWDRRSLTVRLVSKNNQGLPANGGVFNPRISGDGRSVAFSSTASNLVPNVTPTSSTVFVADLITGDVEAVAVNDDGRLADAEALLGSLSFDGRVVAFRTMATNLVSDSSSLPKRDARDVATEAERFFSQVYVRDRRRRTTELVSVNGLGQAGAGDSAEELFRAAAFVSRDGQKVVFHSQANNFEGDVNRFQDVFVHTRQPVNLVPSVFTSVLPSSRSGRVGNPLTVFATIISVSDEQGCKLTLGEAAGATMEYRSSDPLTNEITGQRNEPVDLVAGLPHSFVVSITPEAEQSPSELAITAQCETAAFSGVIEGVNTLAYSASVIGGPDIIALAATASGDGVVDLPSTGDFTAFSVAAVNLGATAELSVSASSTSASLDAMLVCETNSVSGACLSPPAPEVVTNIAMGLTPTFSVFVRSDNPVEFDPASNRVQLQFTDGEDQLRGRTSVAIR